MTGWPDSTVGVGGRSGSDDAAASMSGVGVGMKTGWVLAGDWVGVLSRSTEIGVGLAGRLRVVRSLVPVKLRQPARIEIHPIRKYVERFFGSMMASI